MTNRTLTDEIITLIQSEANNNPAPKPCKIIGNYGETPYSDVEIEDLGKLIHKKTIGSTKIGLEGIICFLNGNLSDGVVITYDESSIPEILSFYQKNTIDLVYALENYGKTSNNEYYLFRGDCWTINNNFEASASITSRSDKDLKVTGTFRTQNDIVGLYWNSKDLIEHPYISYGTVNDYSNVILSFDYEMTGCKDFSNGTISITIGKTDGSIYYLTMNRFIENNHVTIDFSNLTLLTGNIYIDATGEEITVTETTPLDVTDIEYIMFVLVPPNYVENKEQYTIIDNLDFTCEMSNIEVSNGKIRNEFIILESHEYRLCEGYDDIYNLNPRRICKEMRKLGYTDWVDLYVGASHFYEKSGIVGDIINIDENSFNHNQTEKMVLNPKIPLNKAFISWLDCYSRELKENGTDKLIISVSMENLQCPASWRQKTSSGDYALTGWTPSTFFYSPCNNEVVDYMESVSEKCLDIVVANGLQPILQMGEAWWWWNENDKPNQPPCFYDDATRNKYYNTFGDYIPEYSTSSEVYDEEVTSWLNQQLVNYSDKLRGVVKDSKYDNGLYMALFFPPSVTDVDRVPPMMREVNYLRKAYDPLKLDVLELEDYDWVTGESKHHDEVYSLGNELGFSEDRLHYYGGFVQYPEDAPKFWNLISKSMETAINKKFKEVFVWAGSQVRRDSKFIGHYSFELIQRLLDLIPEVKSYDDTNLKSRITALEKQSSSVDTGWVDLSLTGNFYNFDSNNRVQYRKVGSDVQITGLPVLNAYPSALTELIIGTLPEGFRPIRDVSHVCELKDDDKLWTCTVKSNGDVTFNRLRDNTGFVAGTAFADVLKLNVTFLI
ncbi:MAG: hypothetical protein IJF83_03815 [Methanobrevibacter sp.]|nr:hypothetical protein [Methanobrevibacter sp.]